MKKLNFICLTIICLIFSVCKARASAPPLNAIVPLGGNGFVTGKAEITDNGLVKWADKSSVTSVYFRVAVMQELQLALRLRVPAGSSVIRITLGKTTFTKKIANTGFDTVAIGKIAIRQPGYIKVDLQGIKRTGSVYAEVTDLIIRGQKADTGLVYVKQGSSFHFGRRGPSVHLRYTIPQNVKKEVKWFYNEITVPAGNDVEGSYFQADGFGQGYFGMQVNSASERRVLFSVWSPFETEDPKSIPDSMKINLIKKGVDVHIGEFGNEGAGGQSYKQYAWQAGKTYAFLLSAQPNEATKSTTFTAYFKDKAINKWFLIASFKRPQTVTYLTNLYSFLENFIPENGDKMRMAYYNNQWIGDNNGNWQEITGMTYTADATAKMNYRKDYAGGVNNGAFFLKNCGFFNKLVPLNKAFNRAAKGDRPAIDITALPVN